MKKDPIAFISDIHSNHVALAAVLEEVSRSGARTVMVCGDIAGYHTQINECCKEIRERGIPTVLGNHDWYLAWNGKCSRSKSVNIMLDYQRKEISESNKEWLKQSPLELRSEEVRVVHGGWSDPIDEYLIPTEDYFTNLEGKFFVSGHTHIPRIEKYGEKTYFNPGSVGQPRDGDPRASFALLTAEGVEIKRVEYDIEKVVFLMQRSGFPEHFYMNLFSGASKLGRTNEEVIAGLTDNRIK